MVTTYFRNYSGSTFKTKESTHFKYQYDQKNNIIKFYQLDTVNKEFTLLFSAKKKDEINTDFYLYSFEKDNNKYQLQIAQHQDSEVSSLDAPNNIFLALDARKPNKHRLYPISRDLEAFASYPSRNPNLPRKNKNVSDIQVIEKEIQRFETNAESAFGIGNKRKANNIRAALKKAMEEGYEDVRLAPGVIKALGEHRILSFFRPIAKSLNNINTDFGINGVVINEDMQFYVNQLRAGNIFQFIEHVKFITEKYSYLGNLSSDDFELLLMHEFAKTDINQNDVKILFHFHLLTEDMEQNDNEMMGKCISTAIKQNQGRLETVLLHKQENSDLFEKIKNCSFSQHSDLEELSEDLVDENRIILETIRTFKAKIGIPRSAKFEDYKKEVIYEQFMLGNAERIKNAFVVFEAENFTPGQKLGF